MATLISLVKQFGGRVDEEIGAGTTHIVGSFRASPRDVEEERNEGDGCAKSYSVPADFISDSIAVGRRLDEVVYLSGGQQQRVDVGTVLDPRSSLVSMATTLMSDEGPVSPFHEGAPLAERGSIDSAVGSAVAAVPGWQTSGGTNPEPRGDETAVVPRFSFKRPRLEVAESSVRKDVEDVVGPSPWAQLQMETRQGSDAGSFVWGEGGQWVEPFDEESAKHTVKALMAHWHRASPPSLSKRSRAVFEGSLAVEGSSDEDEVEVPSINAVCGHTACSALSICIIDQLETVKQHYQGRVDQYRIKAINRAVRSVMRHAHVRCSIKQSHNSLIRLSCCVRRFHSPFCISSVHTFLLLTPFPGPSCLSV